MYPDAFVPSELLTDNEPLCPNCGDNGCEYCEAEPPWVLPLVETPW
jgi:hypothetical protein